MSPDLASGRPGAHSSFEIRRSKFASAFTLVEVLVTMVLLSLIVLALMSIFNSTQKAFRAGLTQTDILESGRMAMGLMTSDLGAMTPSQYPVDTNFLWNNGPYADINNVNNNINFYTAVMNDVLAPSPLVQFLTASSAQRTNFLESFFSLSRQNLNGRPTWVGAGYAVFTSTPDTNGIYPLYRFYMTTNGSADPASVFNTYHLFQYTNAAVWSHLMDGVVSLTVRPYDPNGFEITNTYDYYNYQTITNQSTLFWPQNIPGMYSIYMYSNSVPATVEVELGVMEDAVLQRAESLNGAAQLNYLSNHVGQLHLFRQRVPVRNVDRSAYQ